MNKERIRVILEKILDVEPDSIRGNQTLASLRWDSMSVMDFIIQTEEECGITLSPSKIAECVRVDDLAALIPD